MKDVLDIAEVVRRTGLSSRTLRFYETRGLVTPVKTHAGRRLYGRAELERINQIVALKRAGLTLAQIRRMMGERQLDLVALIDLQLKALEARQAEIARSRFLLVQAVTRLDPGGPADIETLCDLIRQGVEQQAQAEARVSDLFKGLDIEDIKRRWADLQERIEAAMPIDPASAKAGALYDEVAPLFAPIFAWWKERGADVAAGTAGAPMQMSQGTGWPHLSARTWQFLHAVRRHREGEKG